MSSRLLDVLRKRCSLGAVRQIVLRPWLLVKLPKYFASLCRYRRMVREVGSSSPPLRIYPCLNDDSDSQDVGYYFYQDCWAARQVFQISPREIVDVGSTVLLVGILSQFRPLISVDIRPITTRLDGMSAKAGSVMELPFADGSVECLTTMCVLEHIGLGRYGDPIDPLGTEKAVAEVSRVIAPGGYVVYSVPVGGELLEFNSARRFDYEQAAGLFNGWEVVDECVLIPHPADYNQALLKTVSDPVACFCARKPLNP